MARHEEKYILDYRQYALVRARALALLQPDPHGDNGCYTITSLYYDDPLNTGLYEKLDGLAEHRKFRVRTYGCSDSVIHLERKDKRGILTEKASADLTREQLAALQGTATGLDGFSGKAWELAAQLKQSAMHPTVAVRYRREAFLYPGTDLRLTFDTDLQALPGEPESLFDPMAMGTRSLGTAQVIMEVKYGAFLPTFVRKLTAVSTKQLSVSKYALCREAWR